MTFAKMFLTSAVIAVLIPCALTSTKCKIENRVKVALKTLTRPAVAEVVDCIMGVGPCDAVGKEVKEKVKPAICSDKPCSRANKCSCDQIQVRKSQAALPHIIALLGEVNPEEDQG